MSGWIINNWPVIVAGIAVIGAAITAAVRFIGLPTEKQLAKVKEWLLYAVTNAESELGGGTGKLKLRMVYDLFVQRFPWLVRLVSFEMFSGLVDEALDQMRDMLENNDNVKRIVDGEAPKHE